MVSFMYFLDCILFLRIFDYLTYKNQSEYVVQFCEKCQIWAIGGRFDLYLRIWQNSPKIPSGSTLFCIFNPLFTSDYIWKCSRFLSELILSLFREIEFEWRRRSHCLVRFCCLDLLHVVVIVFLTTTGELSGI